MTHRPPEPTSDEPSVKDLLSELSSDVRTLVQKEVELAKLELQEQASRAAKAAGLFGGGAGAGYFALLLFSFAAAWGLAQLIPTPLGFFLVGLVYAVVAAVLILRGKKQAAAIQPPKQTVQTLKQDVQAAKDAFSRGMKEDSYPNPWGTRPWDNQGR